MNVRRWIFMVLGSYRIGFAYEPKARILSIGEHLIFDRDCIRHEAGNHQGRDHQGTHCSIAGSHNFDWLVFFVGSSGCGRRYVRSDWCGSGCRSDGHPQAGELPGVRRHRERQGHGFVVRIQPGGHGDFNGRKLVFGLAATGEPKGGSKIGREGVRGERGAVTVFRRIGGRCFGGRKRRSRPESGQTGALLEGTPLAASVALLPAAPRKLLAAVFWGGCRPESGIR